MALAPLLGRRRRRRQRKAGLLLPLLLVLLVHLRPAAAFSFSRLPSLVLGRGQQRQLQAPMAVGSEGPSGGGGGVPMSPNYGEEEDDVDVYLQSLKRPDASGPPPNQASRLPQRSPEEIKRMNEEAKARMEAYSRGELPPTIQAMKAGTAPPPASSPPGPDGQGQQQQYPPGFNPNFWQDFYREQAAKEAAEKAAEAAAGGSVPATCPAPPAGAAPITPMPEPVQSPVYGSGAGAMSDKYEQQARMQAAADPYASRPEPSPYESTSEEDSGGSGRFKKMLDMGQRSAQGNSAKEKIKAFLLSKYAPDDMSPQAVAYRKLIMGTDGGYAGVEAKDEYMEGLKRGAKQKAAELYQRVGVPLPPEAAREGYAGGGGGGGNQGPMIYDASSQQGPQRRMAPQPAYPGADLLAERGVSTGDSYVNELTRAKQRRLAGGGGAAPSPPPPAAAAAPPGPPPPAYAQPFQQQQAPPVPPAIDPYTGRPQGQAFGAPLQQQQLPPQPPQPATVAPTPPPAQQRPADAVLLESMQQLEAQLQAHRAGGPAGPLQGQELARLEHLLRTVGALLHEEAGTTITSTSSFTPPPPPPQPQQQQQPPPPPAAPESGYLLPHAARSRLLAAADACQDLAGLSHADAGEAGPFLLNARAMGVVETLEEAFKVVDEILGGPDGGKGGGQWQGVEHGLGAGGGQIGQQPPRQPQQPQMAPTPVAAPVAAAPPASKAPTPAPAAAPAAKAVGTTPPPPPKVAEVELSKQDRAKLQGLMALVLKHSGAFGPSSGPLIGDEKKLLRSAMAEMGGFLRRETEGAYGESVESYLAKHPEALEEYRRLQAKMAAEGSPFAKPTGPPPSKQPAKSYKEQLEAARKGRVGKAG